MYPPQPSLIPAQIALTRYLETKGWTAFFSDYPYWYLGSTPLRWLTGPVIPLISVFLHRLSPDLSLFNIFYMVIAFTFPIGAAGIYMLIRKLEGGKMPAFLASFFYLFGPFIPFLFRFSNGIYLISFSFLPWVLLSLAAQKKIACIILTAFILLSDITIAPQVILGMIIVTASSTNWKDIEVNAKKLGVILFYSFTLATLWYGPLFWRQIIISPSFAGKPLMAVTEQLVKLVPIALAVFLAVFGQNIIKSKNTAKKFAFYWLFIFGFLTIIRFISDPDYWLDWSAYTAELQMGFAVGLALVLNNILSRCLSGFKYILLLFCILSVYFLIFYFVFNRFIIKTFQGDITRTPEYRVGDYLKNNIGKNDKVFLSGSSAFWLNAFFDIIQVRGGRDTMAKSQGWDKLVWEIREGQGAQKSIIKLKEFDIKYLVIHTRESGEYYHDFADPGKFEQNVGLTKIYDQSGDIIYKINSL